MAGLIGNEVIENSLEGYGARGTLASDPGSGGVTLTLTTGHGARFPAVLTGQRLRLQCGDELMICTAHTAAAETFTVTRGAEGTTAVAHAAGAAINAVVTASVMDLVDGRWGTTRYRAARYYGPSLAGAGPDAGGAYATDRLIWAPFFVAEERTFDRIVCGITAAVAATTLGLGIWADNGVVQGPGTLVLNAGTVDSTTTGYKEITISQALSPGLHWLGLRSNGGAPSVRRAQLGHVILGTNSLGTYTGAPYFDSAAAFASDPAWAEAGALPPPYVFLRAV